MKLGKGIKEIKKRVLMFWLQRSQGRYGHVSFQWVWLQDWKNCTGKEIGIPTRKTKEVIRSKEGRGKKLPQEKRKYDEVMALNIKDDGKLTGVQSQVLLNMKKRKPDKLISAFLKRRICCCFGKSGRVANWRHHNMIMNWFIVSMKWHLTMVQSLKMILLKDVIKRKR